MSEGLVVEDLHVSHQGSSAAGEPIARPILEGVDLSVAPGEFVALVGASGSGKTMTAMSVLGLLPPRVRVDTGSIRLARTELTRAGEPELNRVRGGRIGMLYQQPQRVLNPRRTIGSHLREPLQLHLGLRGAEAQMRALELLGDAGLPDPEWCLRAHPHQLSGGMAQRAMMALALAGRPELLLADEPTSALDPVLERQVLDLVDRQRREHALGVLYITHSLATVSAYADRVVVMDAGRIQESGPATAVLNAPGTAGTRALLDASALTPSGEPPAAAGTRTLVALEDVTKHFRRRRSASPAALDRVRLEVRQGEVLGVLGQSGSGKSTLARMLVGLETPDTGRLTWAPGTQAGSAGGRKGSVQLVFQEPYGSFDPRMRLRTSLEAPLLRRRGGTVQERHARIREAVQEVDLDPGLLERHPGQCSGGQLQRLAIARALLLEPSVLICDEVTSALDALTQRTVLDLLLRLRRDRGLTLVVISHDLGVVRYLSDRVAVLHRGSLVELAPTRDFFSRPRHPHSKELVAAALPGVCTILGEHGRTQEHHDAVPRLPA